MSRHADYISNLNVTSHQLLTTEATLVYRM